MESFRLLLLIGIWFSLILTIVELYLIVNKLWKRKHERKVAESQSSLAAIVSIVTGTPFLFHYVRLDDWESFIGEILAIVVSIFIVFVSCGFWLYRADKRAGFFQLLKSAISLEFKEIGNLALAILRRPVGPDSMVSLLIQIAYIDNEFHQKEREYIENFLRKWNIQLSIDEVISQQNSINTGNFKSLISTVKEYLSILPPEKQVAEMIDTIKELIHIDDSVSDEERMIVVEVNSMLQTYLSEDVEFEKFDVFIIPRSEEQEVKAMTVLFNYKQKLLQGVKVFWVGEYFSEEYAEIICEEYRALGLFAVFLRPSQQSEFTT